MAENNIWSCKIGASGNVPNGGDLPMRKAIQQAYFELTGEHPEFLFSGWGAKLTHGQYMCVMEGRKFGHGIYGDGDIPHDEEEE
jgi:hypothetical protein